MAKPKSTERRRKLRPAKNFLGVLGRATRKFSIRKEGSLVQRALSRVAGHKD